VKLPLERLVAYYGKDSGGIHLPFNFQLLNTAWTAKEIARLIVEYETALPVGGWPNWLLGNHDQPRIAARVGAAQARVAAMLLLTLRGTPTMYYGDELGIGKIDIPANAMQDAWEKNEPGLGVSRDPCRTPFHWDSTTNAGFSRGVPWLPLDPNYPASNVEVLASDEGSILNLYCLLLSVRRQHLSLIQGTFELVDTRHNVLAYARSVQNERILVYLNFNDAERSIEGQHLAGATILACTHLDRKLLESNVLLRPHEGLTVLLP